MYLNDPHKNRDRQMAISTEKHYTLGAAVLEKRTRIRKCNVGRLSADYTDDLKNRYSFGNDRKIRHKIKNYTLFYCLLNS